MLNVRVAALATAIRVKVTMEEDRVPLKACRVIGIRICVCRHHCRVKLPHALCNPLLQPGEYLLIQRLPDLCKRLLRIGLLTRVSRHDWDGHWSWRY